MPVETQPSFEALLSLGLYTAIAVGLVGLLMFLSWGIGQRTHSKAKDEAYESGVEPTSYNFV